MNRKVLGAAVLGFVALKAASRHHEMHGGFGPREPGMRGGFGPMGGRSRRGRRGGGFGRIDASDPRAQWVREFHRSLHEADEAEASEATVGATEGTTGDAPSTTNPATAD